MKAHRSLRAVRECAARHDAEEIRPGMLIHLIDLKADWWEGDHLMAEALDQDLRVEVVAPEGRRIRDLTGALRKGDPLEVCGRVVSVRARAYRERLLAGLPGFEVRRGTLSGPDADVPDPFVLLPTVLETRRPGRWTALVHGDLNPRNVLVVAGRPCLIDYAMTRDGEPLLADFVRLEGTLARDVLPEDLSWTELVRLERLLAAACRLDDEAAERLAARLAKDRPELGAAFRIFWAIRRAARETYPEEDGQEDRDGWWRDYLEQLFLFAHLSLKWENSGPQALRATAAMASVAAEVLAPHEAFLRWDRDALRSDGLDVLDALARLPDKKSVLADLAAFAGPLHAAGLRPDDPLWLAFRRARDAFVRHHFHHAANETIRQLQSDHAVYIALRAYIELKGELKAGRARRPRPVSMEEMLESDELLAEAERLRPGKSPGDDALKLIAGLPAVVLLGDAGGGKTTVAREWQYRLAQAVVGEQRRQATPVRFPVAVRAPEVFTRLKGWKAEEPESTAAVLGPDLDLDPDLLAAGAVTVIVDSLNELDTGAKQRVADWAVALRESFPLAPVVVCHRQYGYVAGLVPFPVVTLQKVDFEAARRYVFDYLREKEAPKHQELAKRLARLLLDSPDHEAVRDLARTPLFLWMVVEYFRYKEQLPPSRGALFDKFSRWYVEERHHREYKEAFAARYSYDEKARLLGALGYELVQRRETVLQEADVPALVPKEVAGEWRAIYDEIVTSEMLLPDKDKEQVRFQHQSFQEYFAARRFLDVEAVDAAAVRAKVMRLGWHDTFAVLLGFAGERPEVVSWVISAALEVNPALTARCLRMAEDPHRGLLARFVSAQEAVLRDPRAGDFAHERSARALAEYGRGPARAALVGLVRDPAAPKKSRIEAMGLMANMPAMARLEPVAGKVRAELTASLAEVFAQPVQPEVCLAAISALQTAGLKELGNYLGELIQQSGQWPLARAAWEACQTLGIRLTPRQRSAYLAACRARLVEAERELYQEADTEDSINRLNQERVAILRAIAGPQDLPLLLRRRFGYRMAEEVGKILDAIVKSPGAVAPDAAGAWSILVEKGGKRRAAVDRWLGLVQSGDELTAAAAGHRLVRAAKEVPAKALDFLLDPALPPDRLCVAAHVVAASGQKALAAPLDWLIRSLARSVEGPAAVEALANVAQALEKLDATRGRRTNAVVDMILWTDRHGATSPWRFPLRPEFDHLRLTEHDYDALLTAGGEDARAAIWELSTIGGGIGSVAHGDEVPTEVTDTARHRLTRLAEAERDPDWQWRFASASVATQAVDLLPWLVRVAQDPALVRQTHTVRHYRFGRSEEVAVADFLRSIGCLARLLLDEKRGQEAEKGVRALRERLAALRPNDHRSLVVGLTTGLGYLGDWEPILEHLGPGEPWMHLAARNVFEHWVPGPLAAEPEGEKLRAARWIARRLRDRPGLDPKIRSTLQQIHEKLENDLGRHVPAEE